MNEPTDETQKPAGPETGKKPGGSCCESNRGGKQPGKKGVLDGILYGLVPHAGCIAFLLLTLAGATTAAALFKPLLMSPYLFQGLIALSFIFATISAAIYLKNRGLLSVEGAALKWKYLSVLYGTTIAVNLVMFFIVFPFAANLGTGAPATTAFAATQTLQANATAAPKPADSLVTLEVAIPCSGHAPLITSELKKINGVTGVNFRYPGVFDVYYDQTKTSTTEILSLDIFRTYAAKTVN